MRSLTYENRSIISGIIVKKEDNNVIVKTSKGKVKVYCNLTDLQKDDEVKMSISYFKIGDVRNDNGFNYKNYLYSLGITKQATMNKLISYKKNDTIFKFILSRISKSTKVDSYSRMLLVGIKDDNVSSLYDNLKDLSIIHLFALSGMHLHVLSKLINNVLKYFCSKRVAKIITLLILGLYVFSLPINISLIRAFLVILINTLFSKYLNSLDSIGLVAMIMLWINPYLIYNISFIFSFLIYLIVIMASKYKYSSIIIFIGSIPIILSLNYRINICSFILAFALTPLVEVLYSLIILNVIFVSMLGPVLNSLINVFENITKMFTDFSFYLSFSKPNYFFILVYYYFYFKIILKINSNQRFHKDMLIIISLMLAFYFYPFYHIKGRVVMINVEQGDCFLINQPFNKGNILIDTGGLRNEDVSKNIVSPYLRSLGIQKLDYVFISHNDFDHCGGLTTLTDYIDCQHIIRDYKERMTIGNVKINMYKSDKHYQDENNNSLVIKAKVNNINYLFTGDISKELEYDLYQKYQHIDVDVLKVSHHGSKTGTSNYLLEMTSPKIALISCGKNNVYGHPHLETIKRLKAYGIKIYRTDFSGTVSIVYFDKKHNYIYE